MMKSRIACAMLAFAVSTPALASGMCAECGTLRMNMPKPAAAKPAPVYGRMDMRRILLDWRKDERSKDPRQKDAEEKVRMVIDAKDEQQAVQVQLSTLQARIDADDVPSGDQGANAPSAAPMVDDGAPLHKGSDGRISRDGPK